MANSAYCRVRLLLWWPLYVVLVRVTRSLFHLLRRFFCAMFVAIIGAGAAHGSVGAEPALRQPTPHPNAKVGKALLLASCQLLLGILH
jgi:hypothetical protein